jgi:hypothetical protein
VAEGEGGGVRLDYKGFQRGMRFLRWAAEATQDEFDAAFKTRPARTPRCWRCQRGRGLHLCGSCGVSVKSVYREFMRAARRRRP